jgi:hypothetical protein
MNLHGEGSTPRPGEVGQGKARAVPDHMRREEIDLAVHAATLRQMEAAREARIARLRDLLAEEAE